MTKAELEKLELEHLQGTAMLRAYMHGFFVDARLYRKAQARMEPFAYDAYREKRIAQRLEQERQSRIATVRPPPPLPSYLSSSSLRFELFFGSGWIWRRTRPSRGGAQDA